MKRLFEAGTIPIEVKLRTPTNAIHCERGRIGDLITSIYANCSAIFSKNIPPNCHMPTRLTKS